MNTSTTTKTSESAPRRVRFNDATLRDGMHAIGHHYSVDEMVAIAKKLDEAKVDIIEVSHGDGLAGNSFNYGFSAHREEDYIRAVKAVLTTSKLGALLLPGIGIIDDMKCAKEWGVDTIRIATHCTEADISKGSGSPSEHWWLKREDIRITA
ncbi:MAG: hypothetical protein GY822_25125 [Deltaproteobacteria bacterium]|nr:hypothetical protein [Deltaproteobacteria bacterium]